MPEDNEPKVPDLPPHAIAENEPKVPDLPPRSVLAFSAISVGLGGLALLIWVLYQLFICGCGG